MADVTLPDIGEGITEGEIIKWYVKEGDLVRKYQPIVEVLTVKVNVEIPSPVTGRVAKILAAEGKVVMVGEALATIEPQETPEEPKAAAVVRPVQPPSAREEPRVLATPAVRKLAADLGKDLSKITGTGPEGRITEEDIIRHAPTERAEPEPAVTRVPFRGLRRVIAEKLLISKARGAQVTIFEEVDATAMIRRRGEEMEKKLDAEHREAKLTYLHFIMKAIVKSLREYPTLNSTVDDEKGEILIHKEYNFGVAVDTEHGLMVPVVRGVDRKGLYELAKEMNELAGKARQNRLELVDVQGGTFSISNYGAVGGLSGTPIINYPEVAILGVGRIENRPVAKGDRTEVRPVMTLALTFDHRVVDGAYATRFILSLKRDLEELASQ